MLSLLKAHALTLTRLVARLAPVCVKSVGPPSLQRPTRSDSVCTAHVRHWRTDWVTVNGNGNGYVLEPQLLGCFPAMSELIWPPLVNLGSCECGQAISMVLSLLISHTSFHMRLQLHGFSSSTIWSAINRSSDVLYRCCTSF